MALLSGTCHLDSFLLGIWRGNGCVTWTSVIPQSSRGQREDHSVLGNGTSGCLLRSCRFVIESLSPGGLEIIEHGARKSAWDLGGGGRMLKGRRSPSPGRPSRTAGLRGTVPGGIGCSLQRAPDVRPVGHTLPPAEC